MLFRHQSIAQNRHQCLKDGIVNVSLHNFFELFFCSMPALAINGGTPIRTELFPAYNTITEAEKRAALEVLDSGNLSQFLGCWMDDFFGGPKVREFEERWSAMFGAKHTISVNSNTSGLFAAVGAAGLGPGDEIIVSPYTMSASAVCALVYGAVPVFADIQPDIFTLDPKSIEARITPRTKAIMVVHIFGHPADMDPIMDIARKHNLVVIEDCAQAPLTTYKGRMVGTIGDMGVFSLNYHKHIHTGEGGMVTTNNDEFAERVQLIRNHGETSLRDKGVTDFTNMWGFNYRLTEMQAAIGITQLERLERYITERIENCNYIVKQLSGMAGITPPTVYDGCRHVYYVQPFTFDEAVVGVPRNHFVQAVAAELPSAYLRESTGKLIGAGYTEPLYLQPMYQTRMGTKCSFNCPRYEGEVSYAKGLCPVAEDLHYHKLFSHEYMRPPMTRADLDDFVHAVHKVYEHRFELLD
jgi:dTDP-4-amino-4,6-dideoxygalactose transaminase